MDYTWGNVPGSPYHKPDEVEEVTPEHIEAKMKETELKPDPWEGDAYVNSNTERYKNTA
jgi:hypothetical protein